MRRDDLAGGRRRFRPSVLDLVQRGFLVLRRIDWSTPAVVLEKIIRYEAVHQIRDWVDLRGRIDSPDRRCYAFFQPGARLTSPDLRRGGIDQGNPRRHRPDPSRLSGEPLDPERATTAVFYSISNCQRGLQASHSEAILIKQVVAEICRETPRSRPS